MSRQPRLIQLPLVGKIFLCVLAIVYTVYMVALVRYLYPVGSATIAEHPVETNLNVVRQHWTVANMQSATNADEQINNASNLTQQSSDTSAAKAAQQEGKPPKSGEASYPLSTVGKVFFTNSSGQNFVCSGTAVASLNQSVVDTAGHCLYWQNGWTQNVIFCPLYDSGNTPYGCWAARETQVPSDWIGAGPNDLHHDFGMAIVANNSQGALTDMVGGAGWAYNQPIEQPYYAYGYPAAYPHDGQTMKACDKGSIGKKWQLAGGTVISIPCDMTGGSSGGPWFIKMNGNWYLDGHNDFTASIQPGHMFSPHYDDTWYALYDKAQHS